MKPSILISPAKEAIKALPRYIKDADGQVLLIVPDKTTQDYFILELRPNFDEEKLIIGTRKSIFTNFENLKLIIIEDPLNEAYKSEMAPKYNTPDLAEKIAEFHGAQLMFVSSAIGVKDHLKIKSKDYELLSKRTEYPELKIINMANEIRMNNFDLFSREMRENIVNTLDEGKKVLIFSPRRGFASLLVCQNCAWTIKCPNCSVPLKVHKSTDLILKCHRCSHAQQFPKFCQNCNSPKLKTSGPAGTQKIYDRVREFLNENNIKAPILIMDSDVTKNDTEEDEVMETIARSEPSVLVATQMIFSYRYALSFALAGVINTDSLITIPDYNIEEKLLYQLKKLTDFNPDKMILQTYNPDSEILKSFESSSYDNFYEKELKIREFFGYPPFARLTKLTYRHTDQKKTFMAARALVEKLKIVIAQLKLGDKIKISASSPGFIERERGLYNYNIILKSPPDETPKEILKFVPPGWIIDVDPRSTL